MNSISGMTIANDKHFKGDVCGEEDIFLSGCTVDGRIQSSARSTITLINCTVNDIEFKAKKKSYFYSLSLNLDNSTINGDVVVDICKRQFSSRQERFAKICPGAKIDASFESVSSTMFFSDIAGASLYVGKVSYTIDDDSGKCDVLIRNATYPLDSRIVNSVKIWCPEIEFSEKGEVLNTHGKVVKTDDRIFGQPKEDKSRLPVCRLSITGTGTIAGKILFNGCKEKLIKGEEIQIKTM